jgi:Ca2+-binding EF-hand superfamily protein
MLHIGAAAAQSPPPEQAGAPTKPTHPTQPKNDRATFESLDKDGDGRISRQEAESDAKVKQQFTMYDKNGNGYIDRDEVMTPSNTEPEPPKP